MDPSDFDMVLDSVDYRVTDDMNVGLSCEFLKDRVELDLSQMASDKSSRPDGFNVVFYKSPRYMYLALPQSKNASGQFLRKVVVL